MENINQTQQLINDLRRAKEADARRHRLVSDVREPALFARHSLARS